LFEYIIRRVEVTENNKIIFSCLDTFKQYDFIKGIPTKDISEKDKYDFFVFLPLVFNDINKDWRIETAFFWPREEEYKQKKTPNQNI